MCIVENVLPAKINCEKDKNLSCSLYNILANKKFKSKDELIKKIPDRAKIIKTEIFDLFSFIKISFLKKRKYKKSIILSTKHGSVMLIVKSF